MKALDETIHQPTRLKIMAALAALDGGARLSFVELRDLVSATDGNLGAHIQRLESAEYVKVHKYFAGRKPHTDVSLTSSGRAAFEKHVSALREIIGGGE